MRPSNLWKPEGSPDYKDPIGQIKVCGPLRVLIFKGLHLSKPLFCLPHEIVVIFHEIGGLSWYGYKD